MKYFFVILYFCSINITAQNIEYNFLRPSISPKISNRSQIFKGQVREVNCNIQTFSDTNSQISDHMCWKFDQIGNLIYFGYTINGKNGDRYLYFFDGKNNLTSTEWYSETTNELFSITKYKYDEFNRLENIQEHNKRGDLLSERKFFYKNSSKPYKVHIHQDNTIDLSNPDKFNSELSEIYELEYDEKGNLVKWDYIHKRNKLQNSVKFVYDEKNRCILEDNFNSELKYAFQYDFNDSDNSVTIYNYLRGVRRKFLYNKYHGDKIICVSDFKSTQTVIDKEYGYDDRGNLKFLTSNEDNKKFSKLEQDYTYDEFGNYLSINKLFNGIKTEFKTFEYKYY